jgi:integrase/recombinase XerD
MKVEDFYIQKRRGWVRLHEKAARPMSSPATTTLNNTWIVSAGLKEQHFRRF